MLDRDMRMRRFGQETLVMRIDHDANGKAVDNRRFKGRGFFARGGHRDILR